MTLKSYLYDQFREPRGPVGVLVGRIMSKRASNQERSAWTVGLLDLQPDDRVLELGFGPGLGLEAALRRVSTGRLVGLDHSATMRTMATRRLRADPGPLEPELLVGDAEAIPDDLGSFDKVYSCNVWLFWNDPVAVFSRLRDHLEPGASIAVTHLPRHSGATRDATEEAAAKISTQLAATGYGGMRTEFLELSPAPAACVLATTPVRGADC